ncbi:MAG: hypothetical protein L6R42_004197 [Xanthoria sp. 1 TBL-2021]|nr:MAG: hypothetical protein L6R42_004197 [Xanthoria sp. 1 TBL-2021]
MDLSAATARSSNDTERDDTTDASQAAKDGLLPSHSSNDTSRTSSEENKFQGAISAWRNINLTKLVPELDTTASDIVNHQRDALVSRKDLAQKTKDFRKLDDGAKLAEFKSLLKSYQTFIDLLTSHGKTTSAAFLQIYSSISEAPDPYPLLEASVDAHLLSEDTLPKLSSENEHLQRNIADLGSQLSASEKQLDEERIARKSLEDSCESKLKDVESSWRAVLAEKQDNWEVKEKSLEDKIESQDRLLNELKASYEVSQRLGHTGDNEGESRQFSASAAELEIVSSDLERTSQRLAEVQARNEQLRVELAELSSGSQRKPVTEEDPANVRLRSENSSLLRKMDTARLEKDAESRKQEARIRALEKDTKSLQRDREELRERIHSWRDYNDIKRELEIFKSIELSTLDDDEAVPNPDVSNQDSNVNEDGQMNGAVKTSKQDSLEQLLLARNKKMSNEMAVLRVSHQDLQERLDSLQETLSRTNADLERAQNLNATLENDLEKVQQEASSAFPSSAMSTTGTYTSRYPPSSITYNANSFPRRGRASPTSSIISGFDPQGGSRSTLESLRAGEPVGGGSGILPMIQAQRDRFKQKNQQLEQDLSKQHSTVSSLRQEIASLQKDNLNLYEKSRYVSTYSRGPQASSASSYVPSPQTTTIPVSADTSSGLSLDRYRSAYEANISPFAAFRGRESTRAYKRMSLPERMVFSITRMVLANRTSRNLFAGYCFALHILIFVMLYWMQTMDISKHASSLSETAGSIVAGGGALGDGPTEHGDWHQEGFSG